ncbi:MAG: uroporphyrinogen-III C-methyltransferase [Deltaproteobacteria bacterium]|nr:uroporphyrinogen-III C-methyltransferase [Deltaproteobacteria bacterium]MBW2265713.1 uroporphyrinogen-III C-methyltransferase [Deltaproteobacteria bacterium]OEU45864.1 MAG: uroporphyrinogen-III C-methyltransferase [Desulfobacterales bacterium S7086C20]
MNLGKVYLVGAGPGMPDLITLRGVKCLQEADVVIYDFLAANLLQHVPVGTETIYVGKKEGKHTVHQEKINQMLVEKAREGHTVVRLKGGDPFIFGRGGEEARVLATQNIPFEVVPGVTSGVAAAAFAGIPLTLRGYNTSVAFVTGHEDPTKLESTIEWSKLATGVGTLVIFMGVKNLADIVDRLMAGGRDPKTPTAVVRWGATPLQTTLVGRLDTIVAQVEKAGLKPPAVIVVGKVVELRKEINWFEEKPLFGKTVVVTRTRQQASELVARLSALGAECLECPTIRVVPPDDWSPLDQAIDSLETYDWLVLTSVNGVNFFFDRLFERDRDVRALKNVRTAAIGPATAKRLREFGFRADIVPETYRAESVIEAFKNEPLEGKKILLPRAKEARPILPVEVRKMGATVDEIASYQTEQVTENVEGLVSRLEEHSVDVITFTSSSTVKNFKAALPSEKLEKLMDGVKTACIGPITASTAKELGFNVDIEATEYTIPGLCEAILKYYS